MLERHAGRVSAVSASGLRGDGDDNLSLKPQFDELRCTELRACLVTGQRPSVRQCPSSSNHVLVTTTPELSNRAEYSVIRQPALYDQDICWNGAAHGKKRVYPVNYRHSDSQTQSEQNGQASRVGNTTIPACEKTAQD